MNTKHTCNGGNGPAFGRKTPGCPRCDELLAGAAPRPLAWTDRAARQARHEAEDRRWRLAHYAPNGPHKRGECGSVCTFGEW